MAKNKAIEALINSGADAFSNMYELYITPPGSDAGSVMTVRASSFKIPEAAVETYDKKYHGNSIKAVKPNLTFERKFTVTFRADAAYNLHDLFIKWHGMLANPVTGGVSNTSSHAEGTVQVKALASAYIAMKDQSYSVYGNSSKNFSGDMGGEKKLVNFNTKLIVQMLLHSKLTLSLVILTTQLTMKSKK